MKKKNIEIRNATVEDLDQIIDLSARVYVPTPGYKKETIRGQISNHQEGCFVVEVNDKIVAYSASIIVNEDIALKQHTWSEITAGGFGATHDVRGTYLYGYETCVDAEFRGF